jgi:putative redox protein
LAIALLIVWGEEMQSCTRYLDGKKFETLIGGHRIVCDQHVSDGGTDAGVTPPELLLASLGACAGHYAAEYLRARSLPLTGLQVHVSAEKGTQPARLASFRVEVDVLGIEDRQRQGLLRAVKACLIHNTLTSVPAIEVEIHGATQALSPRGCTALVGGSSVVSL